jgi:hypothetical protein
MGIAIEVAIRASDVSAWRAEKLKEAAPQTVVNVRSHDGPF